MVVTHTPCAQNPGHSPSDEQAAPGGFFASHRLVAAEHEPDAQSGGLVPSGTRGSHAASLGRPGVQTCVDRSQNVPSTQTGLETQGEPTASRGVQV
jgi:hypothetical protein